MGTGFCSIYFLIMASRISTFFLAANCMCSVALAFRFKNVVKIDTSGQFGHAISLCSDLVPESANPSTACWSYCSASGSEALCNAQAEKWQNVLLTSDESFKAAKIGTKGCREHERRYLCTLSQTQNTLCNDEIAKQLRPGQVCYTACGEASCPAGDFADIDPRKDFKFLDCDAGAHRTRCEKRKQAPSLTENPTAEQKDLPVEF